MHSITNVQAYKPRAHLSLLCRKSGNFHCKNIFIVNGCYENQCYKNAFNTKMSYKSFITRKFPELQYLQECTHIHTLSFYTSLYNCVRTYSCSSTVPLETPLLLYREVQYTCTQCLLITVSMLYFLLQCLSYYAGCSLMDRMH